MKTKNYFFFFALAVLVACGSGGSEKTVNQILLDKKNNFEHVLSETNWSQFLTIRSNFKSTSTWNFLPSGVYHKVEKFDYNGLEEVVEESGRWTYEESSGTLVLEDILSGFENILTVVHSSDNEIKLKSKITDQLIHLIEI